MSSDIVAFPEQELSVAGTTDDDRNTYDKMTGKGEELLRHPNKK